MHVQTSTLIDCSAEAAGVARAFVHATLQDWESTCVMDDAELLVSELVTNVVQHGACEVTAVEIARDDREILVSVRDESAEPSTLRVPSPNRIGGFGLQIVDRLAVRWGSTDEDHGKTVWFTLQLPDPPSHN